MGIGNIANTGMQAAMSNMEVISNNIANAGTYGFKKSYINFADIYPSTSGGSSTTPGIGVSVTSISQNFASGGYAPTGQPLDMSINNNGFFILKDPSSGQVSYTRAGRFAQSSDGYIVSGNSNVRLQGFPATNNAIPAGSNVGDIVISTASLPASATTSAAVNVNLNSNSTVPATTFDPNDSTSFNYQSSVDIFDSLGNKHTVTSYYVKTAANNWDVNVYVDGTSSGTGALVFTDGGTLSSSTGLGALSFSPTTGAVSPQTFALNLTGSTQFGSDSSVNSSKPNGYGAGSFSGISIDNNGMVWMQYSNSQKILAGQVALANFQSPQGLGNIGDMSWVETSASGSPIISQGNSTNNLTTGQMELSNVDLTSEMINLINAQHTFQANAQVEQAYNEVMQTILQI